MSGAVYGPLHSIVSGGKFIGVGKTVAYAMVKTGELRTVLVGERRKIPQSELDRFVQQHLGKP